MNLPMQSLVQLNRRHIAAVLVGNGLEFYDFLAYSFFALQIGRAFFPSQNPLSSLLLSLATFGAGFLTRPVGALVIGRYADRIGRRPAMMLTFVLMGIAILGTALTPAYASIGIAAPTLVVFWRLLQGFAVGGELGPTTAFLIEAAPPARRAFYGSFQYATQGAAVLTAGLVGVALATVFDEAALDSWGWRLAFLIGVAVVPIGLWIRRTLPETLNAPAPLPETPVTAGSSYVGPIILGLCLLTAATVSNYVRTYLATYAVATLGFSSHVSFVTTTLHGVTLIIAVLVGGWLGDRFGRRPVMLGFGTLVAVTGVPIMMMITQVRTPAALYLGIVLMTTLAGLAGAPMLTAVTESLPRHIRAGAIGTIYAVAVAVFGGTTQFIVAWLIGRTGSELVPGWYGTAAALIGLAGALALRETRPVAAAQQDRAAAFENS
jgi:MFS family permease